VYFYLPIIILNPMYIQYWEKEFLHLAIILWESAKDEGKQEGKTQCYQIPLWHNKI
jgi:hypothetical protein